MNFNCLVEQTPFRNHNDVAGAQPDVTFEVGARFICLVVEHEDRLVPSSAAPSHLNTLFPCERAKPPRQSNSLHKCRRLADDIGSRPDNLACNENLGLEVVLRDVLRRVCDRNCHVQIVILVVALQLGLQDVFERLRCETAGANVTRQWECNLATGIHYHVAVEL